MKRVLLSAICALQLGAFAQVVIPPSQKVFGNNPIDIKWKYFDTKAVKIIFPESNLKEATRVANIINLIHDSAGVTVGEKRKHLDLMLQTNQVISNGYVGLAPYRSEFYATGIQDFNWLGSPNWLDGLAFHEYRHALQFANGRRGLTKAGYAIGGQTFWMLLELVAVPNWYMEGDAVQTETLFSGAGRGRTPYFFQEQRALLLNNKNYSYIKARNGSFRSLVPDHYRLGYAMLHQVRNEQGPDVWRKILKDGSAYKGLFYSFSRAMKRHSGYTSRKTYYRTYDTLLTTWENELKAINIIPTTQLTAQPKKIVTNYEWPHYLEDGSMIYRKDAYNRTAEIVHLKDGKEKSLVVLGYGVTESFLSVNNNVAAWTQLATDPRWLNRNYSDIFTYNITTKEKKQITSHAKLFSPQYSAKRNQIVAVKADNDLKNSAVFINVETGAEMGSIANPDNDFLSYPKWTKDDAAIVYLAKKGHQIIMLKYDIASKTTTELTPLSQHVIGAISVGKEAVYFSASYSGINNIYAVSLNGDKQIKQITSVKVGANDPAISADEKTLAMIELGYMGNAIQTQPVNLASAQAISLVEPEDQTRWKILTTPIESKLYNRIPTTTYEAKDYKGLIRSPKLHSWNFIPSQQDIHVTLAINNIMNDFGLDVTAGRNLNENTNYVTGRLDFAKYYLPLGVMGAVNGRQIIQPTNLTESGARDKVTIKFTEAIYGAGLSLPLLWYNGIYSTSLRTYVNGGFISTSNFSINDSDQTGSNSLTLLEGGFNFAHLRGRAKQNLMPRFGQALNVYYGTNVSGDKANKLQAQATIYFPGIIRNHGIRLEAGFNQEDLTNNYRFIDNFKHARGYTAILGDQEMVYSINYALPLFYPDWGFGGLFYLKRINANVFGDFSQVRRDAQNKTFDQNSAGFELTFNVVLGNFIPLNLGYRSSYLSNKDYYTADKTQFTEVFFSQTF
ncbi:MAG: hypothetical protein V4620_09990 [Bacteroidota bacterium]